MSNCPNCNKPLDDNNLLRCPHCHIDVPTYIRANLDNLKKGQDFLTHYKEQVDAEVDRKVRRQIIKYTGALAVLCLGGLAVIYFNSGALTGGLVSRDLSERFKDRDIIGMLSDAAKSQTENIIKKELAPQIQSAREATENEITSFKSYLDTSRTKVGEEYDKLVNEASILRERNRLAKLANTAISEGSRQALNELQEAAGEPLKSDLAEVAAAEIMRVKAFYATTDRIKDRSIKYASPEGMAIVDDKLPTDTLISELRQNPDWQVRAKFAQLLASHRENGVAAALLAAAKDDANLDVLKACLQSFAALTGFKGADALDYASAAKWWDENKGEK